MPPDSDAVDGDGDPHPARLETPTDGLLEFRCVRYPDGPDRATLYPAGLTGMARLETWLSANRSAFVDLDAWR